MFGGLAFSISPPLPPPPPPPPQSNAREAAVSQVCLLLLTLLDPRETPSPLQTLAVTVVIKATHSLHCFVPESVS